MCVDAVGVNLQMSHNLALSVRNLYPSETSCTVGMCGTATQWGGGMGGGHVVMMHQALLVTQPIQGPFRCLDLDPKPSWSIPAALFVNFSMTTERTWNVPLQVRGAGEDL